MCREEDIKKHFSEAYPDGGAVVDYVNFAYDVSKLMEIKEELDEVRKYGLRMLNLNTVGLRIKAKKSWYAKNRSLLRVLSLKRVLSLLRVFSLL